MPSLYSAQRPKPQWNRPDDERVGGSFFLSSNLGGEDGASSFKGQNVKPGDRGLTEVISVVLVLVKVNGQLGGSELVEDAEFLRRLICEVDDPLISFPFEEEAGS